MTYISRPARIRHNNENLPIVWIEDVKGGYFIVEDEAAMLAIPKDKLVAYNRVIFPSGNTRYEYELIDLENHTNIASWKKVSSGSIQVVDTYGDLPVNGDDVGQLIKVKNAVSNIGRNAWAVYMWSAPTIDEWNVLIREDAIKYITEFNDSLLIPSNYYTGIAGTNAGFWKGKNFSDYMDAHFSDVNPTLLNRSASLSGVAGIYEVGTPITPTLSASFYRGLITNGAGYIHPTDGQSVSLVGVPSTYSFRLPSGLEDQLYNTSNLSQSHLYPQHIIAEGANWWSVIINYLQGTGNYYNNKGVLSNIFDGSRVASSITAYNGVTGYYASYFGYSVNPSLTSAEIIGLITKNLVTSKVRTFTGITASGGAYVYYAYRSSYGDLNSIIQDGAAPVLGAFTKVQTINVTNLYGIVETYNVYRSNATNAFTNNSLAFS